MIFVFHTPHPSQSIVITKRQSILLRIRCSMNVQNILNLIAILYQRKSNPNWSNLVIFDPMTKLLTFLPNLRVKILFIVLSASQALLMYTLHLEGRVLETIKGFPISSIKGFPINCNYIFLFRFIVTTSIYSDQCESSIRSKYNSDKYLSLYLILHIHDFLLLT